MSDKITVKHNSKKLKDWRIVEFNAPITESFTESNGDFLISGIAINETTTRNGITYIAEELSKAASTFRDKPILLDHKNEIKNIVGRTTENVNFSPDKKAITFEGKVMDKTIKEMIADGRIKNVSIGAMINDLQEDAEAGTVTAIGMEGLELSFVAVPGDAGAGIDRAIQNSLKLRELFMSNSKEDTEEEVEELPEVKTEIKTEEKCKPQGIKKTFEVNIDGQIVKGKGEVKLIFN